MIGVVCKTLLSQYAPWTQHRDLCILLSLQHCGRRVFAGRKSLPLCGKLSCSLGTAVFLSLECSVVCTIFFARVLRSTSNFGLLYLLIDFICTCSPLLVNFLDRITSCCQGLQPCSPVSGASRTVALHMMALPCKSGFDARSW